MLARALLRELRSQVCTGELRSRCRTVSLLTTPPELREAVLIEEVRERLPAQDRGPRNCVSVLALGVRQEEQPRPVYRAGLWCSGSLSPRRGAKLSRRIMISVEGDRARDSLR